MADPIVTRIQAEIAVLSEEIRECIAARLKSQSDERKAAISVIADEKRAKRKSLEQALEAIQNGAAPSKFRSMVKMLDVPSPLDEERHASRVAAIPKDAPAEVPEFVKAAKERREERERTTTPDPEGGFDDIEAPAKDPFDAERAQRDFVYFCERCLTITYRPGMNAAAPHGGSGPMVLTSAQKKVAAFYIKKLLRDKQPTRTITLKGRQLGHTTVMLAFAAWMIWLQSSYHVMLIIDKDAHASTKRQEFVSWFDNLNRRHPGVFPHIVRGMRESKQIGFSNRCRVFFESAESTNPGTSEKVDFLILSEMPKWPAGRAQTVMRSVAGAIPFKPYTLIVNESTADGIDAFKRQWDLSARGQDPNAPTPIFLSWTLSEEYQLVVPPDFAWSTKECHGDWDDEKDCALSEEEYARMYKLTPGQVLWRRAKITGDFGESRADFDKEYPTTDVHAYRSVGAQFFTRNVIKAAAGAMSEMSTFEITDASGYSDPTPCAWVKVRPKIKPSVTGSLVIRHMPEEGKRYFIGVDTAEGLEIQTANGDLVRDSTDLCIMNEYGTEVAYFSSGDPIEQLWHEVLMVAMFYNNATINGEKNNTGLVLMTNLVLTNYPNLWARTEPGKAWRDRLWSVTNNATRRAILSGLRTFLAADPARLLLTPYTAEQILNFIKGKNGKPQAAHGFHDDAIFSKAMCLICLPGGEDVLGKVARMGTPDEPDAQEPAPVRKNVLDKGVAMSLLGFDEDHDIYFDQNDPSLGWWS